MQLVFCLFTDETFYRKYALALYSNPKLQYFKLQYNSLQSMLLKIEEKLNKKFDNFCVF